MITMGRITDIIENKIADVVRGWDQATLDRHTLAKGDAALDYINNNEMQGPNGVDPGRLQDLQTDPGGFVYKSEILQKKAYFYQNPRHREIVFTHNTIMDAAIKKIKKAVTSVQPEFFIPSDKEDEEDLKVHKICTDGWEEVYGQQIIAKSIEKSIKHGFIIYEPLKIPEKDLEWYTNAPFFIRAWDEIRTKGEYIYGMATQYFIHSDNPMLVDYTIDITLNSKKRIMHPRDEKSQDVQKLHAGLFFDPDNTDNHHGKPWFLGCWDNIIDYESIKEARNSYDEQIGNGFIVVGVPSKDYDKVKANVKAKIKNIRREQGLIIPIDKETPIAIEFKGSGFQVDFNADLNDIRRDIIANLGFPELWLFGDAAGAMESSGKNRMNVQDEIKNIFSVWKRYMKLILKYHGYINELKDVVVRAPYELQLTEAEKGEIDNLHAQTVDMKAQFLTLDEIRKEFDKDPIDPAKLSGATMMETMPTDPNGPNAVPKDGELKEAKTGPNEEKKKTDATIQSWIRQAFSQASKVGRSAKISDMLKTLEKHMTREEAKFILEDGFKRGLWDLQFGSNPQIGNLAFFSYFKKDSLQPLPSLIQLDSLMAKATYEQIKGRWGIARDTIARVKKRIRDNNETHVKTDSIMLDSVEVGPDIYISSGLVVPAQTKFYEEYGSKFIRSPSQLSQAFDRHKADILPFGVYQSNGHDEGTEVGEEAHFGELKLDRVAEEGIYGTAVYDLTKVDEILGKDNWIRKRIAAKKGITTSIGLASTDVPLDKDTKYEINHKIKSMVATQFPRNESAGVE